MSSAPIPLQIGQPVVVEDAGASPFHGKQAQIIGIAYLVRIPIGGGRSVEKYLTADHLRIVAPKQD